MSIDLVKRRTTDKLTPTSEFVNFIFVVVTDLHYNKVVTKWANKDADYILNYKLRFIYCLNICGLHLFSTRMNIYYCWLYNAKLKETKVNVVFRIQYIPKWMDRLSRCAKFIDWWIVLLGMNVTVYGSGLRRVHYVHTKHLYISLKVGRWAE